MILNLTYIFVKNNQEKRRATLATSKAARSFAKRTWAIAKRFISRIGTISFCRAHTLGGYLVEKTDILDSSRATPGLAKGQKHKDSIVHRAATLLSLDPASEKEATIFYELAKSTCDGLIVWTRQLAALACENEGAVLREDSTIGSLVAKNGMNAKATTSGLALRIGWTISFDNQVWVTPLIVTAPDASCGPRREGGSLESRGLVRSFEKLLRYAPLGLPIVAGIIPEAEVVRQAGLAVSRTPQLAHPAVAALVPPSSCRILILKLNYLPFLQMI